MEKELFREDMKRIVNIVQADIDDLEYITTDWAQWDDTYEFVVEKNKRFTDSNITDTTFAELRLNFLFIFDTTGQLVFGGGFDLRAGHAKPPSASFLDRLRQEDILPLKSDIKGGVSGILLIPEGPVMFSLRSILTGNAKGPARGSLLMGRFFDDKEVKRLSETLRLPLTVWRFKDPSLSTNQLDIKSDLLVKDIVMSEAGPRAIQGSVLIRDVRDNPGLVITTEMSRDIYIRGENTLRYFMVRLVIVGFILALLMQFLLWKYVVSPLSRLNSRVREIADSPELKERVEETGRDEIASLSGSINEMLTALEKAEATTKESEEKFRTIFETSNDAFMLLDEKGFIDCNDTTLRTFACESRDEFIGRHLSEYSPPTQPDGRDSKKTADEKITTAFREGRNFFEWMHRRATGEDFSAEVLLTPLKLEGKYVLQATVRDITERKHIEEKLRLDAAVFKNTAEGIMVTDVDSVIQSVNPAFVDITGFSVEEAIRQNPRMLKSDKHDKEFYQELWSTLIDTGKWKGEIWNKRKDGELYLQETTINAIKNEKREVVQYAAIFSDITERKKAEDMLRYLSSMDGLTGIANRRTFDETLDKEWRRALRSRNHISLLIMDIDYFKKYNDSYGHQAGDRCLQKVANTFKEPLKRPGDLVARYGGEEFSVILPVTEEEGASGIAETMRKNIESLRILHEKSEAGEFVTISVGIATVIPQQDMTHASLIEMADKALYKAKESGRNCVKRV